MRLQPIVYTTSMDRVVDWYAAVLGCNPVHRSDVWTSFSADGATLALHRVEELPEGSRVELSLVATESLEALVSRLTSSGIAIERGIQEETFGRSLLLRDPEGLAIQVNEHEA